MPEKQIHEGSIKFEAKDNFWCATAAFEDEGKTLLIDKILLGVIHENEEIKAAFMDLMLKTFKHMVSSADPDSKVVFLVKTKEPNMN